MTSESELVTDVVNSHQRKQRTANAIVYSECIVYCGLMKWIPVQQKVLLRN